MAAVRSPAPAAGRAQSCVNRASLELGRCWDDGVGLFWGCVGLELGPRGRVRLVGEVGRSRGSHQGSKARLCAPAQGGLGWRSGQEGPRALPPLTLS